MKKNILYSFLIIAFSFCASSSNLPNDVRWVVNSSEYEKLCRQIYSQAIKDISKIFIDGNSAIIMDLDETALDNSQYQIELYDKGKSFSMESWSKWVIRAEAKLVPGAKEFFDYIRKMNIQIIFISNRMNERLTSTIRNMKKAGIYNEKDIYLLRLDKQDKKYIRRNEVYTGTGRMKFYGPKNIVGYFGDAMGDFPEDQNLGKQYIFPNPMYGKW